MLSLTGVWPFLYCSGWRYYLYTYISIQTHILQISFLKLSHRFEFELSTGSYVLGLNLEIRYNIILISDKNPTYNNNLTNYFQFVLLLVPLDSFQFYVAHYNEQIN